MMDLTLINLVRTMQSYFRIGTIRLKDDSGSLVARTGDDSANVNVVAYSLTLDLPLPLGYGGTGNDLSTGDGALRVSSGTLVLTKHNYVATAAPTSTDDSGDDYSIGSIWIDTTLDDVYMCVDSTASAAVWRKLN